jgi:hypothetical protein
MVDRTRLSEAVVEAVGFYDGVEEAMPDAFRVLVAAVRAVVEAPEMRWCEIHGDWSPTWDGSDVPPSLCRWAHHVLKDSPDKPCHLVTMFLVPSEEET